MTQLFLGACVAAVRLWTYVYTCGLPAEIRNARRDEIACDLWHGMREAGDGSGWGLGLHMMLRLFLGIPDDLGWRVEQQRNARASIRTLLTAGSAAVLALIGVWTWARVSLPPPPPAREVRAATDVTYPPPPPPPPSPSPSNPRSKPVPLQATYGRASYTIATQGSAPARIKEVPAVYPPILMT